MSDFDCDLRAEDFEPELRVVWVVLRDTECFDCGAKEVVAVFDSKEAADAFFKKAKLGYFDGIIERELLSLTDVEANG
jgi:hypothetical protein